MPYRYQFAIVVEVEEVLAWRMRFLTLEIRKEVIAVQMNFMYKTAWSGRPTFQESLLDSGVSGCCQQRRKPVNS